MNFASPYGDNCPYCKLSVPQDASTCAECGAAKGIRADKRGMWVRFVVWVHTVGLASLVTVVATVNLWMDAKYLFAATSAVLGSLVVKGLAAIWKRIFGSLQDRMWVQHS